MGKGGSPRRGPLGWSLPRPLLGEEVGELEKVPEAASSSGPWPGESEPSSSSSSSEITGNERRVAPSSSSSPVPSSERKAKSWGGERDAVGRAEAAQPGARVQQRVHRAVIGQRREVEPPLRHQLRHSRARRPLFFRFFRFENKFATFHIFTNYICHNFLCQSAMCQSKNLVTK